MYIITTLNYKKTLKAYIHVHECRRKLIFIIPKNTYIWSTCNYVLIKEYGVTVLFFFFNNLHINNMSNTKNTINKVRSEDPGCLVLYLSPLQNKVATSWARLKRKKEGLKLRENRRSGVRVFFLWRSEFDGVITDESDDFWLADTFSPFSFDFPVLTEIPVGLWELK